MCSESDLSWKKLQVNISTGTVLSIDAFFFFFAVLVFTTRFVIFISQRLII